MSLRLFPRENKRTFLITGRHVRLMRYMIIFYVSCIIPQNKVQDCQLKTYRIFWKKYIGIHFPLNQNYKQSRGFWYLNFLHCIYLWFTVWLGWAMVLGSFQFRGVLLLLHIVGQGPAVLAAGAGRVGYVYIYIFHLSSLSNVLSFGRRLNWLNYCRFGC